MWFMSTLIQNIRFCYFFWRCETCSTKVSFLCLVFDFCAIWVPFLVGYAIWVPFLSTFLGEVWWHLSRDSIVKTVCVHMNWVSIDSRRLLYLMHAPCDPVSCYYHPYYNSSSKRGKFVVNWCCMCKKDEEIGGSLTASLWFYLGSLAHGFLTICMSWQMLRSVIPLNGVWKGAKVSKRGVDGSFTCIFCDEW